MSEIVLEIQKLTKKYGSLTAVHELSLKVYQGEVFGFLGPNGAGKTTSIRMICGLTKPDSGRVLLHGNPIDGAGDEMRARIGVCPQEIVLWERLTCLEQLQFIGQMYALPSRLARQRAEQLLEILDLTEKRNQQARTLSGGMQRRLNLAMALVHDPEILVLDEPEAGLDPQSRIKVREFIQSLARHKTILFTTHNMDEAERLVDRLAIIDHGQLLVLDTPQALKNQVGAGDVLEIGIAGEPDDSMLASLQRSLDAQSGKKIIQAQVELSTRQLTLRALQAITVLPGILDLVRLAGLQVGEVRLRPNTLEDVFIQLTGRSLRQ